MLDNGPDPLDTPSDPALDASLKRRIERQARAAVGDRVRELDVRVVGREVKIRARPARIWQRRGVRRALETLPALTGTSARVDLLD